MFKQGKIHKYLRLLDCVVMPSVYWFSSSYMVILKLLLIINFRVEFFIMIKHLSDCAYILTTKKNDDNGQLYNAKGLILQFVNGKWNENVLKCCICHTEVNLPKIALLSLSKHN